MKLAKETTSARPHPGPLPRERGNASPGFSKFGSVLICRRRGNESFDPAPLRSCPTPKLGHCRKFECLAFLCISLSECRQGGSKVEGEGIFRQRYVALPLLGERAGVRAGVASKSI